MSSEGEKPQEKKDAENAGGRFRPRIEWDDVEITFSDWVLIQGGNDGSVILSFFQDEHPYLTDEERKQPQAPILHCVARLAVSPQQFDRIMVLYTEFQRNLKEFLKTEDKSLEQQKEGQ
ncbi:MAG: hypothetical protein AABO57_26975 [Acidobacteriota bacterium]